MEKCGLEIERKFIIKKPDLSHLSGLEGFTKSAITQIYLKSSEAITKRVRKREYPSRIEYTETEKVRLDKMTSQESEREITEEEYLALAKAIDPATRPLHKTRYTVSYLGQTLEIDVYPEWTESAIMEIELEGRDAVLNIPDYITVKREVTGNKAYSNASMARSFPKEEP